MKITYDPRYNISYIRFREKQNQVEAIKVSDELVVDITPDGTVYGVELLNASDQLLRDDTGKLVMINESTGEHAELTLSISNTSSGR